MASTTTEAPTSEGTSLLTLPFDIHVLLLDYLSTNDILKLRTISKAYHQLYTSPKILSYYLQTFLGVTLDTISDARLEFDRFAIPEARTSTGNPTGFTILEDINMSNDMRPYFTKQHPHGGEGGNGVVCYRNGGGDLVLVDLSDKSKSVVFYIDENWSFALIDLKTYNANIGVESKSRGWFSRPEDQRLRGFEIRIHDDYEYNLLIEIAWNTEAQRSRGELKFNFPPDRDMFEDIVMGKRIGMILSLDPASFGHPTTIFHLPHDIWPYGVYRLNNYYVTGLVISTRSFFFLRYAKTEMTTIYSLPRARDGSWPPPAYVSGLILGTIHDILGLSTTEYVMNWRMFLASNLDIHIQVDVAGELLFIITGLSVTVFNCRNFNAGERLPMIRKFYFRQRSMKIYMPQSGPEEVEWSNSSRLQLHRHRNDGNGGAHWIAPSVPRIVRCYLPRPNVAGSSGTGSAKKDEGLEMWSLVKAYNFGRNDSEGQENAVPFWQRPEFLVAWEFPLTIKGIERWSVGMLNQRAGFPGIGSMEVDLPASLDEMPSVAGPTIEDIRNSSYHVVTEDNDDDDPYFVNMKDMAKEHPEGLFPSNIIELHDAWIPNPSMLMNCFENHMVKAITMPQPTWGMRKVHEDLPRWIDINPEVMWLDRDPYMDFAASIGRKGRTNVTPTPESPDMIQIKRRDVKRQGMLKLFWNKPLKGDRPFRLGTAKPQKRGSVIFGALRRASTDLSSLRNQSQENLNSLPTGSVFQVKVGVGGTYLAYVLGHSNNSLSSKLTQATSFASSRGRTGYLVIVRYC